MQRFDRPTERGQDGVGQLVGTHRRGARGLEPECCPDREGRAPGALRIVGRHHHPDPHLQTPGILEDRITATDPKALVEPFTQIRTYRKASPPNDELREFACAEGLSRELLKSGR